MKELNCLTQWTYLLTNGNSHLFCLSSRHKLGLAGVEEMQLLRVAAERGVVLLNEEPANLVFGNIVLRLFSGCWGGSGGVLRGVVVRGRGIVRGSVGGIIVGIGRVVGWVMVRMVRVVGSVEAGGSCFSGHGDELCRAGVFGVMVKPVF